MRVPDRVVVDVALELKSVHSAIHLLTPRPPGQGPRAREGMAQGVGIEPTTRGFGDHIACLGSCPCISAGLPPARRRLLHPGRSGLKQGPGPAGERVAGPGREGPKAPGKGRGEAVTVPRPSEGCRRECEFGSLGLVSSPGGGLDEGSRRDLHRRLARPSTHAGSAHSGRESGGES